MHETDLMDQFVELRVQGLSVPKISEQIGVPASTLYHWDERATSRISKLKLLLIEQVEQRILGTQYEQYAALANHLKAVDKEIASDVGKGVVQTLRLSELVRLGASLRRQLYRLKSDSLRLNVLRNRRWR